MTTTNREICCWTCGFTLHEDFRTGIKGVYARQASYTIVRCRNCGILTTWPRPSRQLLSEIYRLDYAYDYHQANQSEKILRARGLISFVSSSVRFYKNQNFLELGSSAGALSNQLNSRFGMSGVGTDIAADESQSTDSLKFIKTSIEDFLILEKNKFDFVFISHTLEHILNPHEILQKIKDIMSEASHLVIVVPNATRRRSKSWGYWQVPIHISHFDLNSLKIMLESTGYTISRVGYRSIDILGMGLTVLNQLNIKSAPKTNRFIAFLLPLMGFIWHGLYRFGSSDLIVIAEPRKSESRSEM